MLFRKLFLKNMAPIDKPKYKGSVDSGVSAFNFDAAFHLKTLTKLMATEKEHAVKVRALRLLRIIVESHLYTPKKN